MGKVIWTDHLFERVRQRGLNPSWVDMAIRFPDEVLESSTTDSKKHIKTINGYKIVAAVKNQGNDWIITSAWWNPIEGHRISQTPKKPFLERTIYNLVVYLEKLVIGKK